MRLLTSEQGKLRAYSWSLTRDDFIVEEIIQDMAVIAIEKREQIHDSEHFMAWARTTCRNLCLAANRRKNRRSFTFSNSVLDMLDGNWEKLDDEKSSQLIAKLRKCISQLTQRARRLLEYRYVEGLRPGEVAKRLEAKASSIYVSLLRVHRALAECMEVKRGGGGGENG